MKTASRERIGEVIEIKGMRSFLEAIGVAPQPQQIKEPRKDPFMFYTDEDMAGFKAKRSRRKENRKV